MEKNKKPQLQRNSSHKTYKGRFKPKNPSKYKGDVTDITFRSSWELRLMRWLDSHPDIIAWGSEVLVIPYEDPITGKIRRYFTDFWVQKKNPDSSINTIVIEVKPLKETFPPAKQQKNTKRYIAESQTYETNTAKWQAAERYCAERGWKFVIMTEKQLFGKSSGK